MNMKCNILVAYPYLKDGDGIQVLQDNRETVNLLLDSGAFTAWKAGEQIKLEDYENFVRNLPVEPWRYFTLDVIGDPEGTVRNYNALRERALNPIPIFTRGEDLRILDRYYETSDLVGIGGLVGTKYNKGFVKWIMNNEVKGRKVHLLGFTQNDFLFHYRPFSCDSSSWSGAVRYASIKLYHGNGRWTTIRKKDFIERPSREIRKEFEFYEEDIQRLARADQWRNSSAGRYALETISYKSWTRYQIDIEQKLGTKFFLAVTGKDIRFVLDAFNFWARKLKINEKEKTK